jgi:hypothetical protein
MTERGHRAQCHFFQHKFHMRLDPDSNTGRRDGKPATNGLCYGTANFLPQRSTNWQFAFISLSKRSRLGTPGYTVTRPVRQKPGRALYRSGRICGKSTLMHKCCTALHLTEAVNLSEDDRYRNTTGQRNHSFVTGRGHRNLHRPYRNEVNATQNDISFKGSRFRVPRRLVRRR